MVNVSIIIPIYNVEKYLDRCIKSIRDSNLSSIEIILVDDGSPDSCPALCDEYARQESRIKVVHKKNEGLGYARNSGLEVATGEYVAFIDSDDYVDVNMFADLYQTARNTDADAVFCGFNIEVRSNNWTKSTEVTELTIFKGEAVNDFMLDMVACNPREKQERKYYMSVWHAIYKREIIEQNKIRFHSERDILSEDIPFQIDFLKHAETIAYIPENYYYYCNNGTSLTSKYKKTWFENIKNIHKLLSAKLSDYPEGPIRADRFFIGYVRSILEHLMKSEETSKLSEIKLILNDPIWIYFKSNVRISDYSRSDIKIMFYLTSNRQYKSVYLYFRMLNFLKKALHKA